jgi:glycine/D-amino acid oxidase-like deaminating enzyme
MQRALDIAIVGYGVAGISAAIHLRRSGHRITHFERNVHNDVTGALDAFVRIRTPQLRRHHRASRWLTPLFQAYGRAPAFLRDHLLANAMNLSTARQIAQTLFS